MKITALLAITLGLLLSACASRTTTETHGYSATASTGVYAK